MEASSPSWVVSLLPEVPIAIPTLVREEREIQNGAVVLLWNQNVLYIKNALKRASSRQKEPLHVPGEVPGEVGAPEIKEHESAVGRSARRKFHNIRISDM